MALSFSTGMTLVSAADSATNWSVTRIAGTGGGPTFGGQDTTVFIEGTASNSSKISVANTDAVHILNWYANAEGGKTANTTVNLTTAGNEVICGWVNITTISAMRTQANGGLYILLASDAGAPPTTYSKWYIGGSDNYAGGWQFFMVDTRRPASITAGGGCDLTAVRQIGFGIYTGSGYGTIKSDNIFVDAMWYGRPRYQVSQGSGGPDTASWAALRSNSASAANGLINEVSGVYQLSCGIRIGSSAQSAATTFTDSTGQILIFKRYTYHNGISAIVDALRYEDYYTFDANGTGSNKTAITLGSVVGAGDNRQGVLGGGMRVGNSNVNWSADFATNKTNLSAANFYGFSWLGAKAGIRFDNNSAATETNVISNTFTNCGEVHSGTTGNGATILNCILVDPYGETTVTDSYGRENFDTTQAVFSGSVIGVAQSFAGLGAKLTKAQFLIRKTGSPTGNITAKLYAHSGAFGSSSIPTGAALATSSTVDISILNNSYKWVEFIFDGTVSMNTGTNYCIAIEYSGGSSGTNLDVGVDASVPTHGGNYASLTGSTWTANSGRDTIFRVFGATLASVKNRGAFIKDTATNVKRLSCITSGTPSTQHMTHISATGTVSVPYNGIIFYGNYSSGTLWHGEASAASATITVNATNNSNPDENEFNKTGSPPATVTVSNPTSLTINIVDPNGATVTANCEVTIVKVSDETVLYNDEDVTTGSTIYNYNSGAGTSVYINVHNVTGYQNKTAYLTLSSSSETFTVQLDDDRFYSNP